MSLLESDIELIGGEIRVKARRPYTEGLPVRLTLAASHGGDYPQAVWAEAWQAL